MKRRLLASILSLVMVLSLLPTAVLAEVQEDGFQGITIATAEYSAEGTDAVDMEHTAKSDSIFWKIEGETLYIKGTGEIPNYSNTKAQTNLLRFTKADWYGQKDSIKHVVIGAGITRVGELTITNMTELESIEIQGQDVTLVNGAVNNYEGNNNETLTVTVPLSVYQQNQMGEMKWFAPASRVNINNPAINFSISDSGNIGSTFNNVLELSTENSDQWTKQNISDIINEYNRYSALPDVVKTELSNTVGQPLAKLYAKATELCGWPEGAKGINIALEGFNGSNGLIGTSDTFWYLLKDGKLTLGGEGAFPETGYDTSSATEGKLGFSRASWYNDRASIHSVDVADGITELNYLNLTNLYHCDDIYLRNPDIKLNSGSVNGYTGDANGKLTMHLYKSAYDKMSPSWYTVNNLTEAGNGRYLDPTITYSFLEAEDFEAKYSTLWTLSASLNDEQKEQVQAAYSEYQAMDAEIRSQLMNTDTLPSGQTYGAKLLELYSLTTDGATDKFPNTDSIYYSYNEETKTLTLTYTGTGSGVIPSYNQYTAPLGSVPYETVIISDNISSVGDYALANHGAITVYASLNTQLAENYAAGSTVNLIYSETKAFIDSHASIWSLSGQVPAAIREKNALQPSAFSAIKDAAAAYKNLDNRVKEQLKSLTISDGLTYYQQLLKVTGANDLENMTQISGGIPDGMAADGSFTYMEGIRWTLTKNEDGTDTWTLCFETEDGQKVAIPRFLNSAENTSATDFRNQPWYANCFSASFHNKITKTYLGEGITGVGQYGLIHLSKCTDFYFENPNGVDLAGYAFDYYGCFPKFTPNIYLHSSSTLASNWADDLNKGADSGKNHTTADFKLIYTDAIAFEQNTDFTSLWTMDNENAMTEENTALIKAAMDAYNALSEKAKAQLQTDKCNDTDTYADKLLALAQEIGLAGNVDSIQYTISSDGKTLTVTGSGSWQTALTADVSKVENLVIDSAITINAGALESMISLKSVTAVRGVKVSGENVFPNQANLVIHGYADVRADSLESYAKANNIKFQLTELNILCIGNSHTYDYTTYMQSILNDVNANLEGTKVQLSFLQHGSRKIGITQTHSDGRATNYSHESCIQDVVNKVNNSSATSSNDVEGDYFKNLNPASNTWDLIIIQDYRESCVSAADNASNNSGQDYVFIDHLRGAIKNLRSLQPTAQVAWFMDWMDTYDYSKYPSRYTENSLSNYTAASDKTEGNPDFIIAGATFIGNAMTSYLGQSRNLEDTKPLHTADTTNVPQLWRDNTHMSYETGRYLAGTSVAAKLFTDIFSKEITFKEDADFYSALSYNPNSKDSNVRQDWPGEFTPEIVEIVKAAAKASVENPTKITSLKQFAEDPVASVKTLVESANFTNTEWNESALKAAVEAVLADSEYSSAKVASVKVSGSDAAVTLRYGYSEATAALYTPADVAAAWTTYIESTNLGSTKVPGSDKEYSSVPDIQTAMAKGYSDIWAATTKADAEKALNDSKANLLKTVKDYVKYLADTVYNNGDPTVLNGKSYTVSEADYKAAVSGINSATEVSGVLSAYNTMLSKQVCRTVSSVSIAPSKDSMVGSGTVTLTVTKAPAGANVTVTCDDSTVTVKDNGDGTYTVTLPNTTKTYTFTASIKQSDTYTAASNTCTVSVTRYVPSAPGSSVSVPATANGSVTVSPSTASKGTTVTVTTKPNEGYELGSLEVFDKNGNALALKDLGNGKYSFTMPDGKVSVNASFVKASVSTGFADVPANAYYADAVKWAVDKGVTNGLSANLFGPYEPCTRAQIVTFLWRAAGSPEPKTTTSKMTDLAPNAYYYKAVLWAIENGITSGMTDTTFVPNATCTRGQSVTFLYRALGKKASGSANFSDVSANAFYADAVNWAVESNVTNGTSATTFSPSADCTRAEIVTFLYRAYQGK